MKILIYGAGVIGSIYGAKLEKAGNNVSILARGKRLEEICENGIILEDALTSERECARPTVVENLLENDTYDLIMVTMKKHQVFEILPYLSRNKSPNVLFMTNNAGKLEDFSNPLGDKRALFGFPATGGYKENEVVRYLLPNLKERLIQATSVGELSGLETKRVKQFTELFRDAGFNSKSSRDIEAWLKTHAALVLPLESSLLKYGDNYALAKDKEGVGLCLDAIREGFEVIEKLGYPVTPTILNYVRSMPDFLVVKTLKTKLNSKRMEVFFTKPGRKARDEMEYIAKEFQLLIDLSGITTPAINKLYGEKR